MSTTRQQSTESDLEEEAFRISEATNDDGTVDVEIENVEKKGDEVTVVFETPWLETEEETMPWPKVEDNSYKIVQICEETIGSFAGVTQLEGSTVRADPDNWEIITEREQSINADTVKRILDGSLEDILALTALGSVATIAGLFILALAYPFGVTILSLPQGVSLTLGAIVVLFISAGILEEMDDD